MNITDVRIRKITTEGKMKAIVSITFNEEFVIHDIKVIEGQNGLFIAMPSRKTPDGEFKDIAHPINSATREKIQKAILDEYEKVKNSELQGISTQE
ncbi:MAG: septation regulator SpoVG [Sarcina ventriculi]|uniref:Septation regulator SpoVG n=1 Tax=Candidatus Sarcina troglodytae TaxID=2726954 RepID=A0ACD1BFU7_9CLOT|nr:MULTISPECIES: septation regulator SpoVG [Sarcina]MDO4401463.1 septation regulator SpoVG [Clostridiaceae bacterium]MCI5637423.1 septation regulator SpoVG [Sarcina ventriculi]MDD7372232.1 septation regulator SpoVG [Sarcina ventriculi]MDY7062219.1 septation regulator SpoVG [Sarcina ventriculi]QPJ86233.1 septation regulator SpoVG [Sarcina sp. JB2]